MFCPNNQGNLIADHSRCHLTFKISIMYVNYVCFPRPLQSDYVIKNLDQIIIEEKKILLWPYYSKKCHFSLIYQIITSVQYYIFWFFSLPLTPGINLSLQNTFLKNLHRSNWSHGSFWNSGGKHHFQLTETVLYNSLDLYVDVSSADVSVKPEKTIHVFILIQYNK